MSDFKAKIHQIPFRLGLRPRPRRGAYNAPRSPSWIQGGYFCGQRERRKGALPLLFRTPKDATVGDLIKSNQIYYSRRTKMVTNTATVAHDAYTLENTNGTHNKIK